MLRRDWEIFCDKIFLGKTRKLFWSDFEKFSAEKILEVKNAPKALKNIRSG